MYSAFSLGQLGKVRAQDYLIEILSNPEKYNSKVRSYAAYSLGGINSKKAKDCLLSFAGNANPKVRAAVIRSLSLQEEESLGDIFVTNLDHNHKEVVIESLKALARLKDRKNTGYIERIINGTVYEEIEKTAIAALGRIKGEKALAIIIKESRSNNAAVRKTALASLAGFRNPRAEARLILALKEKDNEIKVACLNALRGIDNIKAKRHAQAFLKSRDWQLRYSSLLYLSQYFDAETVNKIIKKADDVESKVRQAAIVIIAEKIPQYPVLSKVLEQKLHDFSDIVVQTAAIAAVPYLDDYPKLRPPVVKVLEDAKIDVQKAIVSNLGRLESDWAVAEIKPFLQSKDISLKQTAILSLAPIDTIETKKLIKPFINDPDWQIRLTAVETLRPLAAEFPDLRADFIKAARYDPNLLVRCRATLGLGGIEQLDIIDTLKINLGSDDWRLRLPAVRSLAKIKSPEAIKPLAEALGDSHPAVRYISLKALENKISRFPEIITDIRSLLDDKVPQIRSLAVSSLGKSFRPEAEGFLLSALEDPSAAVRQQAVINLGLRAPFRPGLIEPLLDAFVNDSDAGIRKLAGISLKAADVSPVRQPIRLDKKIDLPVKAAVMIPGVDDYLGFIFFKTRSLDHDHSENWPLRQLLELGGIKVIEHRWEGRLTDIPFTQMKLDDTINQALDIAAGGKVLIIGHSGGNLIAEKLFSPFFDSCLKNKFRQDKIDFLSLGSPSWKDFSHLDSDWKNIYIYGDAVHDIIGGKGFLPFFGSNEMPYPSYKHTEFFRERYKMLHRTYENPLVISDIIHRTFPELDMPQLPAMIDSQDISKWKYFPTHGRWPGIYDFSSVAPPGAWRLHTKGIDFTMPIRLPEINPIDSFSFQPAIGSYGFKNLAPNRWSDLAVPPAGTGFKPGFMSTPPPALIEPPVFNPSDISFPPPGAVNINTGIPGAKPYTGGTFTPSSIPDIRPIQPVRVPSFNFNP